MPQARARRRRNNRAVSRRNRAPCRVGITAPCRVGITAPCRVGITPPRRVGITAPCRVGITAPCRVGMTAPCRVGITAPRRNHRAVSRRNHRAVRERGRGWLAAPQGAPSLRHTSFRTNRSLFQRVTLDDHDPTIYIYMSRATTIFPWEDRHFWRSVSLTVALREEKRHTRVMMTTI